MAGLATKHTQQEEQAAPEAIGKVLFLSEGRRQKHHLHADPRDAKFHHGVVTEEGDWRAKPHHSSGGSFMDAGHAEGQSERHHLHSDTRNAKLHHDVDAAFGEGRRQQHHLHPDPRGVKFHHDVVTGAGVWRDKPTHSSSDSYTDARPYSSGPLKVGQANILTMECENDPSKDEGLAVGGKIAHLSQQFAAAGLQILFVHEART